MSHRLPCTICGWLFLVGLLTPAVGLAQLQPLPGKTETPATEPPLALDALPPGAVARLGTTALWHGASIRALAFAPGDDVLASQGDDNRICLWDATSGKRLHQLELPLAKIDNIRNEQTSLTYSGELLLFSGDGKRVGFADAPGKVYRVWDVTTGKEVQVVPMEATELQAPPQPNVFMPAGVNLPKRFYAGPFTLSGDGQVLAMGGGKDGGLVVWDLKAKKELARFQGHQGKITGVVLSGDGKQLASAGEDQTARLYDLEAKKELRVFRGHRSGVQEVAFAQGGRQLLSAAADGMLRLWDCASGRSLLQVRWRPSMASEPPSPDPYGYSPYSGGLFTTLHDLWMTADGKQIGCYFRLGSNSSTGTQDVVVRFDAASGQEVSRRVQFTNATVSTSYYYKPGTVRPLTPYKPYALGRTRGVIARASSSQHIQLFSTDTGKEVSRTPGLSNGCGDVETAGTQVAFTRQNDHTIYLWDWSSKQVQLRRMEGHTGQPIFTGFTPDGKHLLSASRDPSDRSISVWGVAQGEELRQISSWNYGASSNRYATNRTFPSFNQPILSPDGKYVALRSQEGKLRVVSVVTGADVAQFNYTWKGEGTVAFLPDGKHVLIGDCTEERKFLAGGGMQRDVTSLLKLFDLASGKEVRQINAQNFNFLFSRLYVAGRHALLGCKDGAIRTVDLNSGQEARIIGDAPKVQEPPPGFPPGAWMPSTPNMAPFFLISPDRRTIALRATDGSIRLIEIATNKERARFKGHQGTILCMGFSPDGRYLVTGSQDSTIIVWAVLAPALKPGEAAAVVPHPQLEASFTALAEADSEKALATAQRLAGAPEAIPGLLQTRLKPTVGLKPEEIEQKIKDLDSPNYPTRERAQKALLNLGDGIRQRLEKASEASTSTETKNRIRQILERFTQSPVRGEQVREVRAVELLEALGSAPALEVLRGWAQGPAESRLAQEAQEALTRLRLRGAIQD